MASYIVEKVVVLTSPSAVRAILKTPDGKRIFVIQNDLITLLDDEKVSARLAFTAEPPYCVVFNTLAVLSSKKLIFVTPEANRLRKRASCVSEEVETMCEGLSCFYWTSDRTVYRHNVGDAYSLMKSFEEPIKAITATPTKLLALLSTNLHVLDLETSQDLVEVSCEVVNPIDVFWSISANSSFWFLAVVKPQAMDENRTHKILMAEVNDHHITSEDVSPEDVPLERRLQCTAENDKMLTVAENGNVILIHTVNNFGKLDLLYRAEATDTPFTAGRIIRSSKGSFAPRIALGTSNGAVAFLDES